MKKPLIYISYSHKDEKQKSVFSAYLSIFQELDVASIWDDTKIGGGKQWNEEIPAHIEEAAIAILLISKNYLNSDFINNFEVPEFLKRSEAKELSIFPILIKPCSWQHVGWLQNIQILPRYAKPIWVDDTSPDQELLLNVVREIANVLNVDKDLLDRALHNLTKSVLQDSDKKQSETPGPSQFKSLSTEMEEKVSLKWLFHNVPIQFWFWLGSLLLGSVVIGITIGQTTFIQELIGKEKKVSDPPKVSSEELKNRIDQLIQGHNSSKDKLYVAIAEQENQAGKTYYSSDRQPHVDSADRLRKTLKQENETFQEQLNALKALESK